MFIDQCVLIVEQMWAEIHHSQETLTNTHKAQIIFPAFMIISIRSAITDKKGFSKTH